jgi:TonB-dependent starch-binding outer membrane protein SusC
MRHNNEMGGARHGLRRAVTILRIGTLSLGGAALLAAPAALAAQQQAEAAQTGALTGQVVNAQTGEPIPNAQIVVHGTTRGVLSGIDGRFRVGQLRPGNYRVEARSVGFRTRVETVNVAPSPTAEVTFQLPVSAVPLDEVVVTGQPGAIARREIGNSVASINAQALDDAPVFTTAQLMQGRAPGVEVFPTGGKAGQGSRILLRGVTSITQDVHPLVYVDGVRVDNRMDSPLIGSGSAVADEPARDDLNPTRSSGSRSSRVRRRRRCTAPRPRTG